MEPDAADTTPTGRQPNRPEKKIESAPLYAHSVIDSIVVNAPVADVYAYCLQSYQAPPGRFCNGFSAADDVHLGEDGFPMRLDGAFANK
jgi:hypothetical protein